jgi:hypothetical protein
MSGFRRRARTDAQASGMEDPSSSDHQLTPKERAAGLQEIRLALILSASRRMAVLATSVERAGVVIVGAVGQTMRTTAGMESGWISWMLIQSSARLS